MTPWCFHCHKKKPIFARGWRANVFKYGNIHETHYTCPKCLEDIKREEQERRLQEEEKRQQRLKEEERLWKEMQQRPEYQTLMAWQYLAPLQKALLALEEISESEVAEISYGYYDDDSPRYVFHSYTPRLSLGAAIDKVKQFSEGAPVMRIILKGGSFVLPKPQDPLIKPHTWLSLDQASSRMIKLSKCKENVDGSTSWFACYVVRVANGYLVGSVP